MLAARNLRRAFSHLDTPACSIAAWLTPEQQTALAAHRHVHGLKAAAYSQLPPSATAQEASLVAEFRALLEGQLHTEQDQAYASDLRLLQYLHARDLHLGALTDALTAAAWVV